MVPLRYIYNIMEASKRKVALEAYASWKGFDPLIPDNWYSVSNSELMALKVSMQISFEKNLKLILTRERMYWPITMETFQSYCGIITRIWTGRNRSSLICT